MSALDIVRFARGGLRGHRLRTVLSLLGVAIGVASVVMLTSLGEGARRFVVGEFASLGSNLLIVIPGKTETFGATPFVNVAPNDLTVEDGEVIAHRLPAVRRVAPICMGTGPARYLNRSRDVTIFGTTHETREVRRIDMASGRFLPPGERSAPVCVIGAKVRRELFPDENPLGKTIRVGDRRFRVIGVTAGEGTSIGVNIDEVVFVPVEAGLALFDRTSLFRMLIEVSTHRDLDDVRTSVIDLLKERHNGEEDVTVLTQDAVLSAFTRILTILTAALAGIAAISLGVAGIGIMNVMLVSVSERTREIGLLKAVGVTRSQISRVFLIESAIISTTGGLLGLLLGILAGRFLQQIVPEFPVQPPVWAVAAALGVSITLGLLSGLLPARNASRLDPVEALMRKRA